MSNEKLKKLERITFWLMVILLLLTISALALHASGFIGLGLGGFFAFFALICSAVHRACQNRISGKSLFGKKLGAKKKSSQNNP